MVVIRKERDIYRDESMYFTKSQNETGTPSKQNSVIVNEFKISRAGDIYFRKSRQGSISPRSLIISETPETYSRDDFTPIVPSRTFRNSIENLASPKTSKTKIPTPLYQKSAKMTKTPTQPKPGTPNREDDFMKVFNDTESTISGEPHIMKLT
jgi:hypothetical protein